MLNDLEKEYNIVKNLARIGPTLISETARRCGDDSYRDFRKEEYENALLKASRTIAKRYQILHRIFNFTNRATGEQQLRFPSFMAETKVTIEDNVYTKVEPREFSDDDEEEYYYYLQQGTRDYRFNYTQQEDGDAISIVYVADINLPDFELEETSPLIPSRYREELLGLAIKDMAKIAFGRYNGEKLRKYERLHTIYSSEANIEHSLRENKAWLSIKPFKYP